MWAYVLFSLPEKLPELKISSERMPTMPASDGTNQRRAWHTAKWWSSCRSCMLDTQVWARCIRWDYLCSILNILQLKGLMCMPNMLIRSICVTTYNGFFLAFSWLCSMPAKSNVSEIMLFAYVSLFCSSVSQLSVVLIFYLCWYVLTKVSMLLSSVLRLLVINLCPEFVTRIHYMSLW